jgi:DNA topoisomerase-1
VVFVALGQVILKMGWKEFYPYSVLKETILPPLAKGDRVNLLDLVMDAKETQPPARYSQSALIKLMDELGLGTKATRHEIINKLYSRKYIVGLKSIEPTAVAFAVIDALEKYCNTVTKPDMTVALEKEMDSVAAHKTSKGVVVSDSRKMLGGIVSVLMEKRIEIGSAMRGALRNDSIAGKCTRADCSGSLVMRFGKTGKRFLGCSNYPACTQTYPLPQKGKLAFTSSTCPLCRAPMVRLVVKRRALDLCVNMDCASKDEWKKAQAQAAAAGPSPVGTGGAPKAAPKKRAVRKAAVKKLDVGIGPV